MLQKTPSAAVAGTLAALFALGAEGGALDPELAAAIADLGPKDRVDVIIRCAGSVRPDEIQDSDLPAKRGKLIKALRAKSGLCRGLVARELAGGGGTALRELWMINAMAAEVRVDKLERLADRPGVESIGLNREVVLPPEPESPVLTGEPATPSFTWWNLTQTRIPDLWALGYYGQGVVVATLDTGVDIEHIDLAPNWRGGGNSWYDPNGEHAQPHDASGHGTGVMGLLIAGNSTGVDIGAAPGAQWIAAKIFNDAGVSDLVKIHQAYQWTLDPDSNPATDDAPDIVNNSWALNQVNVCHGDFAEDVALLKAAGIAVVFAAGNFGPNAGTSVEPANNPGSVSVGSVDNTRTVLMTSSRGPSACTGDYYPTLVAPGWSVLTTALTGGGAWPQATQYATGTSFAAPHVAGAMAVLKSAFPGAGVDDLESAIRGGALDLGAAGADNTYGAGYLDAVDSYYELESGAPIDSDGDGVSDLLDQCPDTPAGESVDANGCSASQRDTDGDGVTDDLDLCPDTPAGDAVDADGCTIPAGPTDSDGDGYSIDQDCNDSDASIYPGAPEVKHDGIDQDCNDYDLTIEVTSFSYNARRGTLSIKATSALGSAAALRVDGFGPMTWDRKKSYWTFSANVGRNLTTVTISGVEGSVSAYP